MAQESPKFVPLPLPTLILFDLDNTLVHLPNSGEYFGDLLEQTLKIFGGKIPDKQTKNSFWESGRQYPEILHSWGINDIPAFWAEFDRRDIAARTELAEAQKLDIEPDMPETLDRLGNRGFVLAVYSNSNTPITEYLLQRFGIREYFRAVRGLSPLKEPRECKPEIGGIEDFLRSLGYDPHRDRILFIGDSFTDMLAAKRLGVSAVLYDPSGEKVSPTPELVNKGDYTVIPTVKTLLDLIPPGTVFGHWDRDVTGLPIYEYTANQYVEPKCDTFTTYGTSKDQFHQIGNLAWKATVHNDGRIWLLDSSRGFTWLTFHESESPKMTGGGIALVECDKKPIITDLFLKQDSDSKKAKKVVRRTFGTYYFEKELQVEDLRIVHRIEFPPTNQAILYSTITVENLGTTTHHCRIWDYWGLDVQFIHQSNVVMLGNRKYFGQSRLLNTAGTIIKGLMKLTGSDTVTVRRRYSRKVRYIPYRHPELQGVGMDLHPFEQKTAVNFNHPAKSPPALKSLFLASLNKDHLEGGYTQISSALKPKLRFYSLSGDPSLRIPVRVHSPALWIRNVCDLAPKDRKTFRAVIGYVERSELADFAQLVTSLPPETSQLSGLWRNRMIDCRVRGETWLRRETMWHSAYILGGIYMDEFTKYHKLPQGSVYAYGHGLDGAIRDYAIFLPSIIALDPRLARESLLYMLSLMTPDGRLPYGIFGYSMPIPIVHAKASDIYLFTLWAIQEYIYQTRDFGILETEIPYYPQSLKEPENRPKGTVLERVRKALEYMLSDQVGIGEHGSIKINDGDWSDGITFLVPNRSRFLKYGESLFNTAMALAVLPPLLPILKKYLPDMEPVITSLLTKLDMCVDSAWNGKWFYRAFDRNFEPIGDKEIFLEHLVWILIANRVSSGKISELMKQISEKLEAPSPIGPLILNPPRKSMLNLFPSGWDINGGIWQCINFLLVWGYSRHDPIRAFGTLIRSSMARREIAYPNIWYGIWTGPDAYNAHHAVRPGEGFYHLPTPMCDYPAQNMNLHAGFMLGLLKIFGISADYSSIQLDVRHQKEYRLKTGLYTIDFTLEHLKIDYSPTQPITPPFSIRIIKPQDLCFTLTEIAGGVVTNQSSTPNELQLILSNFTNYGLTLIFHCQKAESTK